MLNLFDTHVLLGRVRGSGAAAWYRINRLTGHLLLLGMTGLGKTSFFFWLCSQLIGRYGLLIFDRKLDFRHLLRLFPDKLLIFDVAKDFRSNPLQPPPHFGAKKWAAVFTEFFCKIFNFLDVGQNMVFSEVDRLYKERGIYEGGRDYPSLYELREGIQNLSFAPYTNSARTKDSVCNRLNGLLAMSEKLFDCSIGFDLEKLIHEAVILELHGLLGSHADLIVNYFLHWVFCYRMGIGERGNMLRNLIVFDEAKAIFPPSWNPISGFSSMEMMISQAREFGLGVLAADQTAQLSNMLYANTNLKLLMGLGSGVDLLTAAQAMGLSAEQRDYAHNLGVGEAVVHDRNVGTYVLEIPRFPLE